MARPERVVYDGLAQVAHAIRRSTALYVAMNVLPPEATFEQLKDQAEDFARWIRGSAGDDDPGRTPLGEQWPPS